MDIASFEYGGALSYDEYALQLVGVLTFRHGKRIPQSSIFEGKIAGIRFGLASQKEICTASISDFPISHSSQLTNPILGTMMGGPLSADEQSYELDNVFNYHPDKAVKMGAGNNHVTVCFLGD
uniref:Uncharacterized protein n=1 Tax=Salix viminalis TaxID=40686 RepID=A0A6N2M958_SALVM